MKKVLLGFMRSVSAINKSMVWVTGLVVLFMSVLVTIDVLLRYFFNSPTKWAFDVSTWGTGITAFLLGGYALLIGQHVRVDLFFEKFSKRKQSAVDVLSAILLLLMAIALIWIGMNNVIRYYTVGAISSGGLPIPLWIKWMIVPIGGALIGLQGIVKLIDDISIIATGRKLGETEEGV